MRYPFNIPWHPDKPWKGTHMHREWLSFLRNGHLGRTELKASLESLIRRRTRFAILLFGVDRFRLINHRFGCDAADEVLRCVGTAAREHLRRALVGRWSGDEFLAVLPGADSQAAYRAAEQLRGRIASLVISVGDDITTVSCSFGLACFPDAPDLDALLTAADEALYEAKRTGRNRIVAASGLSSPVHRIGSLVEAALREERIIPAYQPIVELASGRPVAEEALARLLTVDDRILEAREFINAATELSLTYKIDHAIVSAALARRAADNSTPLPVFVNISGNLLNHREVLRELLKTVVGHGGGEDRESGTLVIEITERDLLADLKESRRLLAPFVEQGLRLALDDFGSGYSSFEYLAELPVSYLKIDGHLIQRLHEPRIRAIVRGIRHTAEELGLTVLAECIEQERQADCLREIGIPWAQGHLFGRARVDEQEAAARRRLSVNWAQGYYYRGPRPGLV